MAAKFLKNVPLSLQNVKRGFQGAYFITQVCFPSGNEPQLHGLSPPATPGLRGSSPKPSSVFQRTNKHTDGPH